MAARSENSAVQQKLSMPIPNDQAHLGNCTRSTRAQTTCITETSAVEKGGPSLQDEKLQEDEGSSSLRKSLRLRTGNRSQIISSTAQEAETRNRLRGNKAEQTATFAQSKRPHESVRQRVRKAPKDQCISGRKLRKSSCTRRTALESSEPHTIEQDVKKGEENLSPSRSPHSHRLARKQEGCLETEVTLSASSSNYNRNTPSRKRVQSSKHPAVLEQTHKRLQTRESFRIEEVEKQQPREFQDRSSRIWPKAFPKRSQVPVGTLNEARVSFWSEKGIWPTKEEELMDRFRELVEDVRAKKRHLSRKRSNASTASESSTTVGMSREQQCAPYRHQLFERQLKDCGSFMEEHDFGISPESEKFCQLLLKAPQPSPLKTLFSDDDVFKKTCKRLKGENEMKIMLRISQLIVPPAELLVDEGHTHLAILRETTNACWTLSMPFINPPGYGSSSRAGPRPQPDSAHGFDRDAFNRERLRKLQPFLGDLLTDCSFFAATFQMYFPFLTCEVKCGDGELDVADRQNALSQSVVLLGLYKVFRLAKREEELHREINGFSVSHNEEDVRIYGHYLFIDEEEVQIYRHLIAKFVFAPSGEGDQRWKAYKFVKNIYDLWLPRHFERLCSVIDMLPEVSDTDLASTSLRSGLSQQFENQSAGDANAVEGGQSGI